MTVSDTSLLSMGSQKLGRKQCSLFFLYSHVILLIPNSISANLSISGSLLFVINAQSRWLGVSFFGYGHYPAGYLTEESEHDRLSTISSTSKRMGPLMSAKYRRRSKSTGAINTSVVSKSLFHSTSTVVDRSILGKTLGTSLVAKDRTSR